MIMRYYAFLHVFWRCNRVLFNKIFYASLFLIFFALPVSAFASSAVYYDISKLSDYDSRVDTTAERLSVSYLPKNGNTIVKSGSEL